MSIDSKERSQESVVKVRFLASFVGGIAVTGVVYLIAFGLTLALAPRTEENGRVVVTMPWLWFAALPSLIAAAMGLGIGLFRLRTPEHRIAFLLGAMVTLFFSTSCCVDVLWRDYIGKL